VIGWLAHLLRMRLGYPGFWLLLAALNWLAGYLLLIQIDEFVGAQAQVAQASDTFGVTPMVVVPYLTNLKLMLLLALPLLLGPMLAQEGATAPLWLGSRLYNAELAGGLLGYAWLLALLCWALLLAGASMLEIGTDLDVALASSAWLGLLLLMAFFATLHALIVCHLRNPATALLASLSVNLGFALLDLARATQGMQLAQQSVFNPLAHYASFLNGRPTWAGLCWMLGLLAVGALVLNRRIARMRQGR